VPRSRSFPFDLLTILERPILAYGLAVGSCVNALLLTSVVGTPGEKPLFFAFLTAIAISSWFAGWRPGLTAMLLSFAVVAVLEYHVAQARAAGLVTLDLAFVFTSGLIWIIASSSRASTMELRKSNTKFSGVVQISEDAIVTVDESHAITLFNPGAEKIFGHRAEDVIGRPIHLLLPERYRAMHAAHMNKFFASSDTLRAMGERTVIRGLRNDGNEFPAEASIAKFKAGSEMILTVRLRDISQRMQAEQGLRQLAAIVDSSEDAIISQSLDGVITTWNSGAEKMFGYAAAEIVGLNASMLLPPKFREELSQQVEQVKKGASWKGETVRVRKNGKHIDVGLSISLLKGEKGTSSGLSMIARDITERKRLEEELRQSQKMEAVGRLAGGVAHDFNNLLSVIVGYGYLIHANTTPDHPAHASAQEIMTAAGRAGALTRQLLAFSRKQVLQPEVLDLNSVLKNMDEMLPRLIGEDIDLRIMRGKDLRRVKLDPVQLEQVIMNLVVNSRDAMPNGGKLTIETADVTFDAQDAVHHGVSPGQYVLLAVSDTGEGMDEKTQELIFEPFFTTKEPGKGTGLGLSTVYGIVSQVKGHIWVYSEPGNGTTFKIYFPATAEAVTEDHVAFGSKPALCGTETVLVVEDSELLRNLITQFLRDSGYKVLIATDGQQALKVAGEWAETIDLLLTDVVMPVLGGQELAAKLSAKYPGLTVLFMSGYTNSALMHQGAMDGDRSFLQKPFSPDVLLARVREVLDRTKENKTAKRLAV
jgi:two-component system cell cycle sensor histidine kinase/response regulator CckA